MRKINIKDFLILSGDTKKQFLDSIPNKVYKTERNIGILVALTQVCMILLFLIGNQKAFQTIRGLQYFSLYVFLLIATLIAIVLYRYTRNHHKNKAFLWLRRGYVIVICIWVLGITMLEERTGKGITVYCYLMPTVGAVLLLTPIESVIIFLSMWITLVILFVTHGNPSTQFSDLVNSTFVTVLTLFISYRYYRSTAMEFCDLQTISSQYQEIEISNSLLQELAHVDQLTNLYNRRYLVEHLYQQFAMLREEDTYGMFLMLDIDYFKQYNDSYGHIQGDACLKQLANTLQELCLRYDASPIRFGGEEFLIICMNKEKIDGIEFAKELQAEIRKDNMKRSDVEFDRVSASMGMWQGNLRDVPHIEAAIKLVDDALYEAKKHGRNCIIEA